MDFNTKGNFPEELILDGCFKIRYKEEEKHENDNFDKVDNKHDKDCEKYENHYKCCCKCKCCREKENTEEYDDETKCKWPREDKKYDKCNDKKDDDKWNDNDKQHDCNNQNNNCCCRRNCRRNCGFRFFC